MDEGVKAESILTVYYAAKGSDTLEPSNTLILLTKKSVYHRISMHIDSIHPLRPARELQNLFSDATSMSHPQAPVFALTII